MNKIEEMMEKFCPEGVEYKELGEIGIFYGGLTGKNRQDFSDGNKKYITYKNIYSNIKIDLNALEKVKIEKENEKQNKVLYGDVLFTISSENMEECGLSSVMTEKIEEEIYLNSFCCGYRFNENIKINPEFSKFLFRDYKIRKEIIKTASGVTRYNVSKEKMKKIKIPIPPIEIQEKIVEILDKFTALTEELKTELTARKKQYEYYRDKLLTFGDEVEWKELGEVCEVLDNLRKPITEKNRKKGVYPYYGANGIQDYVSDYIFDGNYLLVGEDGSVLTKNNTPIINFVSGKFWVNNHAHVLKNKDKDLLKYIYYILSTIEIRNLVAGTPPKLNQKNLKTIKIPIPPIEIQEKIVEILDKFDTLCNSLTEGLPKEIELRQKQYEYYRDKLLTFKEKIS